MRVPCYIRVSLKIRRVFAPRLSDVHIEQSPKKLRGQILDHIFYNGWETLVRTLVVGILGYVSLVVLLRISGKRTLSKLNAFDLIVTVALGSTLATLLLSKDVSLAEGALAFALLISLQFGVTWASVRAPRVRSWITGEPLMLFYHGEFLPAALLRARVVEDEVRSAIRSANLKSLDEVEAVVLETDGSLSVIGRSEVNGRQSLDGVRALY